MFRCFGGQISNHQFVQRAFQRQRLHTAWGDQVTQEIWHERAQIFRQMAETSKDVHLKAYLLELAAEADLFAATNEAPSQAPQDSLSGLG